MIPSPTHLASSSYTHSLTNSTISFLTLLPIFLVFLPLALSRWSGQEEGKMGRMRVGDAKRGSHGSGKGAMLSSFLSPSSLSSSDFKFTILLLPSSQQAAVHLCPVDKLFYKGHLLLLHLSPWLSMVRTLLLSSVSTSSSITAITASRNSNGISSSSATFSANLDGLLPDCDSSHPSSVTEDDARHGSPSAKGIKYLSCFATRFSSIFFHHGSKKDRSNDLNINQIPLPPPPSKSLNSSPSSAKEVIKKYIMKVKPCYEKLSSMLQKQS